MSASIKNTFKVECEINSEEHVLVLSPSVKCEYKPLRIPITKDQWDAIRYHFVTGHDDSNKGPIKNVPVVFVI